ncbi:hypothetical protein [Azohydromonas aeria]|uniref:hypothetical protein n=1 Tax=Azohydromonas aeria TaxID=2590212 RepID=UPI0012F98A35|nr:hypothetical protein [Azohydromonas aeria]
MNPFKETQAAEAYDAAQALGLTPLQSQPGQEPSAAPLVNPPIRSVVLHTVSISTPRLLDF